MLPLEVTTFNEACDSARNAIACNLDLSGGMWDASWQSA